MGSIYHCQMSQEEEQILEELRKRIAEVAGVTLVGNRMTVRFNGDRGHLVDVHMIVERVGTQSEMEDSLRKQQLMEPLFEKYPDLSAELFYVEHGEWPK